MRTRIPAVLAAGLLAGLLLCPAPAAAHSFLREAEPGVDEAVARGPKRIALWFNEAVEPEFAAITVTTRKGRHVPAARPLPLRAADDALAIRLPRRLPPGRYVVQWRVVSADSHIQSGTFGFRVKRAATPVPDAADLGTDTAGGSGAMPRTTMPRGTPMDPGGAGTAGVGGTAAGGRAATLLAVARGFIMAGLLLLVGLIVFWLLAWRGIRPGLAPPADVQARFVRRWQILASVSLAATAVATIAGVVLQGAAAADVSLASAVRLEIIEGVLATGFGKAAIGRLVLLELLAVVAMLWRILPLFGQLRPMRAVGAAALEPAAGSNRVILLSVVVVLPLLLTMSMISHATTASPVGLHLAADAVHLAAAGAWIGGLVVLAFAAFPATAVLPPPERVRVLGPPVMRFSRIAAVSVAVVVGTGTIRGLDTVGGWDGLFRTAYGQVLVTKLGVFSVLLALGAFNHLWAVRRIRAAVAKGASTHALAALRRSVTIETALAVTIVVITAILVSLPMASA